MLNEATRKPKQPCSPYFLQNDIGLWNSLKSESAACAPMVPSIMAPFALSQRGVPETTSSCRVLMRCFSQFCARRRLPSVGLYRRGAHGGVLSTADPGHAALCACRASVGWLQTKLGRAQRSLDAPGLAELRVGRLKKLRAEVMPVLVWRSSAWHLRTETVNIAVGAVIRMSRLMMHARRRAEESRVSRHRRAWRESRMELTKAWGSDPAIVVGASAVGVVARLAARPACSVVSNALRWRSAANVDALRAIAVGRNPERTIEHEPPSNLTCVLGVFRLSRSMPSRASNRRR